MIRKLFIALFIIAIIPLAYSQEYKFYALSNDGSNTEPVYLRKLDGETPDIELYNIQGQKVKHTRPTSDRHPHSQ